MFLVCGIRKEIVAPGPEFRHLESHLIDPVREACARKTTGVIKIENLDLEAVWAVRSHDVEFLVIRDPVKSGLHLFGITQTLVADAQVDGRASSDRVSP